MANAPRGPPQWERTPVGIRLHSSDILPKAGAPVEGWSRGRAIRNRVRRSARRGSPAGAGAMAWEVLGFSRGGDVELIQ